MTHDELKTQLIARGWTVHEGHRGLGQVWYACFRQNLGPDCESNGKPPQIVISAYARTVEVGICAEIDGIWWDFKAYSLLPVEVFDYLDRICHRLVSAWVQFE